MALQAEDLHALYRDIYELPQLPMSLESVPLFDKLEEIKFDPVLFEDFLNMRESSLQIEADRLGTWSDVRVEKNLSIVRALRIAIFCPLEKLPLHVNEEVFSPIIKWRFMNAI